MRTNKVTKAVFELVGDKVEGGYSLFVDDVEIPVFLNKDELTKYPEIRVSPFIEKGDVRYQKHIDKMKEAYRHWQYGVFQIDIYSKNIIQAQNIYDVLTRRIYDFFNLETVIFNYNNEFEELDDDIYRTKAYALLDDELFKDIYGVRIDNQIINRVFDINDLELETFFVNDQYFYIRTQNDIRHINIKVLMQGRLFSNGFSHSDNGIHAYVLTKQRNLSSLATNNVERISFDLEILFSKRLNREELPRVNNIIFPKPNVR